MPCAFLLIDHFLKTTSYNIHNPSSQAPTTLGCAWLVHKVKNANETFLTSQYQPTNSHNLGKQLHFFSRNLFSENFWESRETKLTVFLKTKLLFWNKIYIGWVGKLKKWWQSLWIIIIIIIIIIFNYNNNKISQNPLRNVFKKAL